MHQLKVTPRRLPKVRARSGVVAVSMWMLVALCILGCRAPQERRTVEQIAREALQAASVPQAAVQTESAAANDVTGRRALDPSRSSIRFAVHETEFYKDENVAAGEVVPGSKIVGNSARLPALKRVQPDGGPKVNDYFEETDVRQAIQSLASQAKASVIMDEQVSGITNAVIENEPFEAALRKVLLRLRKSSR